MVYDKVGLLLANYSRGASEHVKHPRAANAVVLQHLLLLN